MSNTVKATVNEHHFKGHINVGDETLTKRDEKTVKDSETLRNLVREGTVKVTQGSLRPQSDEKEFQQDDKSGEESEEAFEEKTVKELREICDNKDVKKSGTKDEIVERLKNLE